MFFVVAGEVSDAFPHGFGLGLVAGVGRQIHAPLVEPSVAHNMHVHVVCDARFHQWGVYLSPYPCNQAEAEAMREGIRYFPCDDEEQARELAKVLA